MPKIFSFRFIIPPEANDANDHVNNIAYVRWMQDVAIRHSDAQGCTHDKYRQIGSNWVVRSHLIEYLRPGFAGDEMEIQTWVCNMRRTRSLRRYRFLIAPNVDPCGRAETEWVYADSAWKPKKSTANCNAFDLVVQEEEPY